jgi:hypothetical protein
MFSIAAQAVNTLAIDDIILLGGYFLGNILLNDFWHTAF